MCGSKTSTQKIPIRNPEPEGLTNLRNGLLDSIYPSLQSFDADSWKQAQETANNAMNLQSSLLSQLPTSYENTTNLTNEMMDVARTGNIPSALTDNMNASVNSGLQNSMGNMLNGLANRGVLNSSVTTAGTNQLSNAAAKAYSDNYLNAYNSVLSGMGQGVNAAQNNTNSLLSGIQSAGQIPSQAYEAAYAGITPAYNLWKDWQSSYDNRQDFDTIVTQKSRGCITGETLVRLEDGKEIPVSELREEDKIRAWDFDKGKEFSAGLTAFFKSKNEDGFDVIRIEFEDGSNVGVIIEHIFFDLTEGKFVAVNAGSQDYIGHEFARVDEAGHVKPVKVVRITQGEKEKEAYAPQAEGYWNFLANGFISANDGQLGICNRFEVDTAKMIYEPEKKAADIQEYGLLGYEALLHVISREFFDRNKMEELAVAIGKGLMTFEYWNEYLKKFAHCFLF